MIFTLAAATAFSTASRMELASVLKSFSDPNMVALIKNNPNLPAKQFLRGRDLPEGLTTVHDVQQAYIHGKTPKPKPGKKPVNQQTSKPVPDADKPKPEPEKQPGPVHPVEEAPKPVVEKPKPVNQPTPAPVPDAGEPKPEVKKETPPGDDAGKVPPPVAQKPPAEEAGKGTEKAPEVHTPVNKQPGKKQTKEERAKEKADKAKNDAAKEAEVEANRAKTQKVVDRFKKKHFGTPEFQKFLTELPHTTLDKEGQPVFFDAASKKNVSFDQLAPEEQHRLMQTYAEDNAKQRTLTSLADTVAKNPAARDEVRELLDPGSDLGAKLAEAGKKGFSPDKLPLAKYLPQAAKLKLPSSIKSVGDLKALVDKNPQLFKKIEPHEEWAKDKEHGPESEDFKAYVKESVNDGSISTPPKGPPLFKKGKKMVPFEKLDPQAQKDIHEQFSQAVGIKHIDRTIEDLAKNPHVDRVLRDLANPRSALTEQLWKAKAYGKNMPIGKAVPSLADFAFPSWMTLADLQTFAKKNRRPVPEPHRLKKDPEAPLGHKPPPLRRPYSIKDLKNARAAMDKSLPDGSLKKHLQTMDMHPDDITSIVSQYNTLSKPKIKPDGIEAAIKAASPFFTTDPANVAPPAKAQDSQGKFRKFEKLSPSDQARVMAEHRNTVVAASLALHEQIASSIAGDTGLPKSIAKNLATNLLSPKLLGERDPVLRMQNAESLAVQIHDATMASGAEPQPFKPDQIKKVIAYTNHDPATQKVAIAYMQAQTLKDYVADHLLATSPDAISERDSPRTIKSKLFGVLDELVRNTKESYPPTTRLGTLALKFADKVMSKLHILEPEKAANVEEHVKAYKADLYAKDKTIFDKEDKRYKKEATKYQKQYDKVKTQWEADVDKRYEAQTTYRGDASLETPKPLSEYLRAAGVGDPPVAPDPLPPKPEGFDDVGKTPQGLAAQARAKWKKLHDRFKRSSSENFPSYSSYPLPKTMGSSKQSVYWGVEPYPQGSQGFAPYTSWQQAHARDLGESDYNAVLKEARTWMRSSVLSTPVEGFEKDAQLRAALDLAIRTLDDGKYAVGFHPSVYNQLLARLGGVSDDETLLTIREAASESVYAPRFGEEHPMKAAREIHKFAARIAADHPELAFDLTDLALRVAQDEEQQQAQKPAEQAPAEQKQAGELPPGLKEHMEKKKEEAGQGQDQGQDQGQQKQAYMKLRASVIHTAHQNPDARKVLMPVLKTIKQIG